MKYISPVLSYSLIHEISFLKNLKREYQAQCYLVKCLKEEHQTGTGDANCIKDLL